MAKRLGADASALGFFDVAIKEISFQKSLDSLRGAVPKELMIDGHNPLLLLHGALSRGLHDATDQECLELAQSIRVLLTELTDRIGQLLKEEAGLKQAVSTLLQNRQKNAQKY